MPKIANFGAKLAPPGKSFGDHLVNSAEGATPKASDRGAVRFEITMAPDRRVLRRQIVRNRIPETLSFPICYLLLNFDLRKASKR